MKMVSKRFALKVLKLINGNLSTTKLLRKLSESRLLKSDEIHIITEYLHLICAEYGLQKWFNPPHRVRVKRLTYSYSVTQPVHMTHCK